MPLVNLDDLTILGPGSEWIWLLGQFTALAVTGIAVYRQLAAQRSGNLLAALRSWAEDWEATPSLIARLEYYRDLQRADGEHAWSPYATLVLNQFETLGYLVVRRHIRATDVADLWGSEVSLHWALASPYLSRVRTEQGGEVYLHFEALERELRRIYPRRGVTSPTFDAATIAAELARCSRRVETQLSIRSQAGVIGSVPNAGPPAEPIETAV